MANKKKKGCGKEYTDRRGKNICGQKDWWTIDYYPECVKNAKDVNSGDGEK